MKKCMGCMNDYEENLEQCPMCGYSESQRWIEMKKMPEILPPGIVLGGRFIVGKTLSYADYAITYLAWDALLFRRVVLKEYFPMGYGFRSQGEEQIQFHSQEQRELFDRGREWFYRESEMLRCSQDIRAIPSVYRCLQLNNTCYRVMECLTGCTLWDQLECGTELSDCQRREIIGEIVEELEQLHSRGIIHYNLNLDNIFLEEDRSIRLLGIGMAKKEWNARMDSDLQLFDPSCVAPEVLLGKECAENADLYSLGALMYQLLTGKKMKSSIKRWKRGWKPKMQDKEAERLIGMLTEPEAEKRIGTVEQFRQMVRRNRKKIEKG